MTVLPAKASVPLVIATPDGVRDAHQIDDDAVAQLLRARQNPQNLGVPRAHDEYLGMVDDLVG
jgi:hypothetical protein